MNVDAKISKRLDELIELGKKVAATRHPPSPGHITGDFVDEQIANQWSTSCSNLFSRVFGETSVHFKNFTKHFTDYPKWSNVSQAFGVLLAAKEDFEKESLFNVKQLIEAELFDDFLEQAEHLCDAGYFPAAAVIAGGVLEDGLRKLCNRYGIILPDKPSLDWMNGQLAKQGIYNKLTQKRLTALADLRNNAAHGRWDDFKKPDVVEMLKSVRDFMVRYYK